MQPVRGTGSEGGRDVTALDTDLDRAVAKLGIPVHLVPSLRVGLSLEYDQTTALLEDQNDLVLETTDTTRRMNQLDALMSALDVELIGRDTTE